MVERFGGHVVCSRPCIGDLKGWKTLFACHFYSEGFAGLRAALCIFLDSHERLFLCLLAPWLEFVVVVDLLLNLRIQNFMVVSLTTQVVIGCCVWISACPWFQFFVLVARHDFVKFLSLLTLYFLQVWHNGLNTPLDNLLKLVIASSLLDSSSCLQVKIIQFLISKPFVKLLIWLGF